MNWTPPHKPAELAESRLVEAILDGSFAINTNLPAERELAQMLGVTRPTLRETLQRLGRDGWIEIRHGKPTRVRNYLQEGSLAVLAAIARRQEHLPPEFVANLLSVRRLLAPAYTRLAVERSAAAIAAYLQDHARLEEDAAAFTTFDWNLHCALTVASGNPVFTLILNGFEELYSVMGRLYFELPEARAASRRFYAQLLDCALRQDAHTASRLVEGVMDEVNLRWTQFFTEST